MAYFSNSIEGTMFDHQCSLCKYGEELCPIAFAQHEYNYQACNNKIARAILDALVNDNGSCFMFSRFKKDFRKVEEKQMSLFDEIFGKKNDGA